MEQARFYGMVGFLGSYPSIKEMISMGIKLDPKMNVLYHIRPYFVVIFTYIGLTNRPKIYGIGTSNQF